MSWALIAAIVWAACGVVAYGMCLYDFELEFPQFSAPIGLSVVVGLGGPVGVLTALVCATHYGWRGRPISREEKWRIYQAKYKGLSRESFDEVA